MSADPVDLIVKGRFPTPVRRDAVAADWRSRGFSCGLMVDPPGRVWRDFVHDTDELVVVVEGRLGLTVGGREIVAEPGDEVFIPRGEPHTVRNLEPATVRWLYGYR